YESVHPFAQAGCPSTIPSKPKRYGIVSSSERSSVSTLPLTLSRRLRASSSDEISKYECSKLITGRNAEALPCETENVSSTIQPDCETALNSNNRRDLPTPGSPIAATTWPCPALACSDACFI